MPRQRKQSGLVERYVISAKELEDVQVGGVASENVCYYRSKHNTDVSDIKDDNECVFTGDYNTYIYLILKDRESYDLELKEREDMKKIYIREGMLDILPELCMSCHKEARKRNGCNNFDDHSFHIVYGTNGSMVDKSFINKLTDYEKIILFCSLDKVALLLLDLIEGGKDLENFEIYYNKDEQKVQFSGSLCDNTRNKAVDKLSLIVENLELDKIYLTNLNINKQLINNGRKIEDKNSYAIYYMSLINAINESKKACTKPVTPRSPFDGATSSASAGNNQTVGSSQSNTATTGGRRGGLKPAKETRRSPRRSRQSRQ